VDEVLKQPIMGIVEGAFRFKPADSVFHLVLLHIPLIPIQFNYPCHEGSIAPPGCSVKHYRSKLCPRVRIREEHVRTRMNTDEH
jgi:hypothetical protein